jgi:hypothetical protein
MAHERLAAEEFHVTYGDDEETLHVVRVGERNEGELCRVLRENSRTVSLDYTYD